MPFWFPLRLVVSVWTWQVLIQLFLVDLWWNPAVEAQAGRAHRMGQGRNGWGLSFGWPRGTIEEKIQKLQEQKETSGVRSIGRHKSRGSLTLAQIREILGISEASTWKIKTIRYNEVLKGNKNETRTISIGVRWWDHADWDADYGPLWWVWSLSVISRENTVIKLSWNGLYYLRRNQSNRLKSQWSQMAWG